MCVCVCVVPGSESELMPKGAKPDKNERTGEKEKEKDDM